MKYVMFTHQKVGIRCPVFFPDMMTHADVGAGPDWVATSAGQFDVSKMQVHGDSHSLGLDPVPGDEEICRDAICGFFAATCHIMQCKGENLAALRKIQEARGKGGRPWCVWWFEVDMFSSKPSQHWRDFATYQEADEWRSKEGRKDAYLANVRDLPWHPGGPK